MARKNGARGPQGCGTLHRKTIARNGVPYNYREPSKLTEGNWLDVWARGKQRLHDKDGCIVKKDGMPVYEPPPHCRQETTSRRSRGI